MTFEKVVKVLVDYREIDPSGIKPESTWAELGFDSLDTVELVMQIEEEFGITIEMSGGIKTVGDIVAIIDGTAGESND